MSTPPEPNADGGGSRRGGRLDQWLVDSGEFATREKARAAILAGEVLVDGRPVTKAGAVVRLESDVVVRGRPRYVGRGGDKLAGALADLAIDPSGTVALDAGAATGGFVDCLLQHGAAHVIAVDVGYGQLAWSLRQDPRVTVVERQNLRYLTPEHLSSLLPPGIPLPQLVTLDLSFIGLDKVYPAVLRLLNGGEGRVLALVKPQFEVGRENVGKRGVVRRPELQVEAILATARSARAAGFRVERLTYSKLAGPEGNIEYFLLLAADRGGLAPDSTERRHLAKPGLDEAELGELTRQVVAAAWQALGAED